MAFPKLGDRRVAAGEKIEALEPLAKSRSSEFFGSARPSEVPARPYPGVIVGDSIHWRTIADGMVAISFEVENPFEEAIDPETYHIEAAAFGAFIPNVPIAKVAVGALDPGERREVVTTVLRSTLDDAAAKSLELLSKMPSTDDFPSKSRPRALRTFRMTPEVPFQRGIRRSTAAPGALQWTGNLNIYPERNPADAKEAHWAFDHRVQAGSTGLIKLCVINPSSYERLARELHAWSSSDDWSCQLYSVGLLGNNWSWILGVVAPNEVGRRAIIYLDVRRADNGKFTTINFEFETIAGESDDFGCVSI